jgi:serine/threonine protein kinase
VREAVKSHVFGREVRIGGVEAQGGRGFVLGTDEPGLLLKQLAPQLIVDDPGRQQILRERAERAYQAFCQVNRGQQEELSSLPLEYVTLGGDPAYLMRRAEGVPLQRMLRERLIEGSRRLALAHAVARAFRKLHEAQIIHADTHPDNYFVREERAGFTVIVLDIDDGGLLSPPGPIYPSVQPFRIYKSPELWHMKWEQLFRCHLHFAPDDWALAVLVYQLLVDYQGPFCSVKAHPNPAVTNYTPYPKAAYRERGVSWPMPWQEQLLHSAGLTDGIVSLFYKTFADRFLLPEKPGGTPRTRDTAASWEKALAPQRVDRPVLTVYTLKTAVAPVRSTPPLPVSLHKAVSRMPDTLPADPAPEDLPLAGEHCQARQMPEGALLQGEDTPGGCIERQRPGGGRNGVFGWRTVIRVIVRIFHLRKKGDTAND